MKGNEGFRGQIWKLRRGEMKITNYKIQITKKKAPSGQVSKACGDFLSTGFTEIPGTAKSGHFTNRHSSTRPFPFSKRQYPLPVNISNLFVILGLWFACNLYFVICNFVTPLSSFLLAVL
jgi:hypothetical protein